MLLAITRRVSARFSQCELTYLDRQPIDIERARTQHARYVSALRELGCKVIELEEEPDLADSVFVEDTAVILPELAILARPGAVSRQAEVSSVAAALRPYRPLKEIVPPATLDGGDVLVIGKTVFVGIGSRTGQEAVGQLTGLLDGFGYQIYPVQTRDCLHLKSAVTAVADDTLLVNPAWVDTGPFRGYAQILIDPEEPFAANCLRIGEQVLYPEAFPRTRARLESHGRTLRTIDVSELAKAEGAVTCCSLIVSV